MQHDWDWREALEYLVKNKYLDQPSQFNDDEWEGVEEGIVVQVERLGVNGYFKAKSPKFLEHATALLDKGEVDAETVEDVSG